MEFERERASNSYVISLVSIVIGMPLPIVNLLASMIFYISNRNSTYFVRWHCTQMLISQVFMFILNATALWLILYYWLTDAFITSWAIAVIFIILLLNIIEIVITIISAIYVRKGEHIRWYIHGFLTDRIVRPQ